MLKCAVLIRIISFVLTAFYLIGVSSVSAQEQTVQNNKIKNVTKHVEVKSKKLPPCEKQSVHWMESLHETVSDSVYQSAIWFDNFFIDENNDPKNPKTTARIRFGWEPKARDWSEFDTRFRIKVKLPHFKDKVDLILSDEPESEQDNLPLESVNTQPETNDDHFAAAIRYTLSKGKYRLIESRVGISGGDIFVRAKHKRRYNWDDIHSLKIEPSIHYFIDDGLGAKLLLEYDHQLNNTSQFRINYSIRGSESFSGIRWKHGFYHLKQLEQNAAAIAGIQVEGERNGEDGFIIDKYTLSYRYRFNAIRKWLFFEVEPFLEWPENENYTTTPGIALRIEGYFSKG